MTLAVIYAHQPDYLEALQPIHGGAPHPRHGQFPSPRIAESSQIWLALGGDNHCSHATPQGGLLIFVWKNMFFVAAFAFAFYTTLILRASFTAPNVYSNIRMMPRAFALALIHFSI